MGDTVTRNNLRAISWRLEFSHCDWQSDCNFIVIFWIRLWPWIRESIRSIRWHLDRFRNRRKFSYSICPCIVRGIFCLILLTFSPRFASATTAAGINYFGICEGVDKSITWRPPKKPRAMEQRRHAYIDASMTTNSACFCVLTNKALMHLLCMLVLWEDIFLERSILLIRR